ncbi:hypothetical protein LEP1GSC026_4209 [Leptospira interrogans str. 2002000623]|uniref:Uncharacterized protein n=2 Tax=Leptospira interrogans TaxID=173 RepID=A0A829D7M3_LEPIR|nr:hypothetical protein LEP1GSC027_4345 [Leptospira interrogans str. 2002000624]EKQ37994.1 hypothetical protein LEP1GSC025_4295 [Leptospira interrogans str. 2002000621]EKQ47732.1 hypothetical protein LEP1GSC026_4209 [Leptospira interrogans str. 2002000623]EMJ70106.1 hypothetical protein LEP1GSC033_3481 [Leptospira interrogans str. 2002000632]EMY05090.1 hypothetical protein LEP1GSC029_0700 [Leptospira interrogans str. 2002000626]EMY25073.1 hypothetical protein LEP1GSC115_2379 [Leptospira interr
MKFLKSITEFFLAILELLKHSVVEVGKTASIFHLNATKANDN